MIQLIEVLENRKLEYNRFVMESETGSFLQSYEWGEWQKNLGREVYRFFFTDDIKLITSNNQQNIIGTIQLIKMPLPFRQYYLYAPYGPVMSYQVESYKVIKLLQDKFPKSVFVRVEPKYLALSTKHLALKKSSNIQPAKTLTVDLSKSEDQLLSEMHSKTRYNIRLAQKHGVIIKDEFDITIGHGIYAKEAVDLIFQTAKRQGYKSQGADYFQKMADFFALQNRGDLKLHIYKAIYNNNLLASAIMVDFGYAGRAINPAGRGGTRTFLFGGSSEKEKNVMAPYLMHFQAMLDAKKIGLSYYDFWGVETAGGKTPGFVRFKLGFASQESSETQSNIKEYAGAWDVVLKLNEYRFYSFLRRIIRLF